jgi:hypothetical protein
MSKFSISFLVTIFTLLSSVAIAQPDDVKKGTLYIGAGMQTANVQHHFEKGQIVVLEVAAETPLKAVSLLSEPGLIGARRSGVELVRMEYEMPEDGNLEFRFEPVLNGGSNVVNYSISTLPVAPSNTTASAE